jgi:hypothetical protein
MGDDFTRNSFHPERAFAGVLKQPGAESTDVDFRERLSINRSSLAVGDSRHHWPLGSAALHAGRL